MKITALGEPKVIMSNPRSKHNYFAWPSAARLQNGKIAVVASGYRLYHICPFGKTVISYSEDEGESYTVPAPVIDTVLDDRDGGIVPFGEKGVIVTSFNNTVEFQRKISERRSETEKAYCRSYLDLVTPEEERQALGATFALSFDGGVTFGEIHKSPVTSPHGPVELGDGTLLWVGRTFSPNDAQRVGEDRIEAHKINLDGTCEFVGYIDNVPDGQVPPLSCEPHTFLLEDGTLLTHIRVQKKEDGRMFTIYQSESFDSGKSWTKPHRIIDRLGGSPPHIFRHSSGALICTYGYREAPYGVKAMFSKDNGKTWDVGYDLYVNGVSDDLGYPSSVELSDGSILTVFYAHPAKDEPAVIMQQKWRFDDDEI